MKAVVDTNVLVSGLLSNRAPPARIVEALAAGRIEPVYCEAILNEYHDVLRRSRFRLKHETVGALIEPLRWRVFT